MGWSSRAISFATPAAHRKKSSPTAPVVQQKRFRCKNCGAEISVDPSERSFTCPFCDSTYVLELPPTESDRERPEFVVGFAVTPQDAVDKFQTWLRQNGWFRPGDLRQAQIHDKMRGVYLPFWSFSMLAESRWSAQIGEYWYRTETYTVVENGKTVTRTRQVRETEWWPLSGLHHNYYSGYLVSGSKGLPQVEAERIKPFRLEALKRYQPYFLAGWLSEEYSVAKDAAAETLQTRILSLGTAECSRISARRHAKRRRGRNAVQPHQFRSHPAAGLFADLQISRQDLSVSRQRPNRQDVRRQAALVAANHCGDWDRLVY